MWRFVSFVAETTTKPRLFECIARVTRLNVEVTKLEPNIRLKILFLLKKYKQDCHANNICSYTSFRIQAQLSSRCCGVSLCIAVT